MTLAVPAFIQGRRHSVTDDTLTLQVEHLVLFEVTIATTTQQPDVHNVDKFLTGLQTVHNNSFHSEYHCITHKGNVVKCSTYATWTQLLI